MIAIDKEYYQKLKQSYSKWNKTDKFLQFWPDKSYKYKNHIPISYPIAYRDGKALMVDDMDTLYISYQLSSNLPIFKGNFVDYKAQEFSSILPENFEKLRAMINVPPSPVGYYLSKFEDTRSLDKDEKTALFRVAEALFPVGFLEKSNRFSFLKKTSSVGIPIHDSTISSKIQSIQMGYKIAWELSDYKAKAKPSISEFVKTLYDKYALLLLYKIGTRAQLDKPSKERKDFTVDGREVVQNKTVSQYGWYLSKLITAARSFHIKDKNFLKYIESELTARRFRTIMIMPFLGGFLSFAQRCLIQFRKTIYPHIVDKGADYNIKALISPGMNPDNSNQSPLNSDDIFFVGMDAVSFDRNWHSEVMNQFLVAYDNAVSPPFNITREYILGSAAITNAANKKDAIAPAFITHDNFKEYNGMNVLSNASGSPLTKGLNDSGSTFILETIFERLKLGSFVEASSSGKLFTDKFPFAALVNGDDVLISIKGKANLDKLLSIEGTFAGQWEIQFDKVPMWNNQKVVFDKANNLRLVKNHENIPEKIFKPENPFGTDPTGTDKLLPNLGYNLRKQEYNTEEGNKIYDIMNSITKDVTGVILDDWFKLTDTEKELMDKISGEQEAVNLFEFFSQHEKLQYLTKLDDIPDDYKQLYYYLITPEIFEAIRTRKDENFLKLISSTLSLPSKMEEFIKKGPSNKPMIQKGDDIEIDDSIEPSDDNNNPD